MRLLSVLFTRSFPLLVLVGVLAGSTQPADGTALDDYVAMPDPSYQYTLVNTIQGSGYTAYVFNMISQTWRSPSEVDRTQWQHWVTIVRPDGVDPNNHKALLWISGGDNGGAVPTSVDPDLANIATTTNSVAVVVKMIPNQPLTFQNDSYGPREEDELLSYTWDKYLRGGDAYWPGQLPMAKAAVRAMDTVEDFCASYAGGNLVINEFVVTGASKRGWTTWLTAAVDDRVVAIIPVVIDLLNVKTSFIHHRACYGFWAPAVGDYEFMGIMNWIYTPELDALMALVDPYSYLDRYTMPKFLINAGGDDFFVPDSSQFYFHDLPGENYLQYFPDAHHGLYGTYLPDTLLVYYQAIVNGTPLPQFSWTMEADGTIRIQTVDTPTEVRLYQATTRGAAKNARDFRKRPAGMSYAAPTWADWTLSDLGGGLYVGQITDPPNKGWKMFFVKLTFDSGGPIPFTFTTEVMIRPDTATLYMSVINDQSGYIKQADPDLPDVPDPDPKFGKYYPVGSSAKLEAVAYSGRTFVHWRIYDPNYCDPNVPNDPNHAEIDPNNNPVMIVMDASREVEAVFTGDPLTVTVRADPNVVLTGETSTLTATVAGGVPPYEFNWSTGETGTDTITFVPNAPGNQVITLTVFDGLRTPATDSATVTAVDELKVSLRAAPPVVGTNASSRLTATVTGGVGPFDYTWSTGQTGTNAINFAPDEPNQYVVTVTVADPCNPFGPNDVEASVTVTRVSPETPLADYVAAPDPNYAYSLVSTIPGPGFTAYILDLYSQTWRRELEPNEVDRALWQHWLTIVVPDNLNPTFGKALLFINGGSNGGNPPSSVDQNMAALAVGSGSVIVDLAMVPNQRLEFENDGRMRSEDEIIAYTFRKYSETGDETWPALLPMVKSAVRAMDAVQAFLLDPNGDTPVIIEKFMVMGGSKRGWTTWLTAAVDDRVVAIAPLVVDVLNLDEQMTHHLAVYGFYAPTIQDYVDEGVMDSLYTPEGQALLGIVDPYEYRNGDRLRKIPKFMVNSAGDSFFVPDSSQFYFHDLKGEKYLRYVPNTDHDLGGDNDPATLLDVVQSLLVFYQSVLSDDAVRPQYSWTLEGNDSIRVTPVPVPGLTLNAVNLWQATVQPGPSGERDFRFSTKGAIWSVDNAGLTDLGNGAYRATVDVPGTGWTGFFVELTYGPVPYKFTTEVRVVPEIAGWFELDVQINNEALGQVQRNPEPPRPNNDEYPFRSEVALTAVPSPGNTFVHWELFDPNYPGDANHAVIDDSNNPVTVVMDVRREVAAYFAGPVQVAVHANPDLIPQGGSSMLTAVPAMGWGPFNYLWSTGQTSQTIMVSPTNTSTYTVEVTDTGLKQTAQGSVKVKVAVGVSAYADPNVIAAGGVTTLTATASGGRAPYNHVWSNHTTGASTQVTATTTTVFSVTTTDADSLTAQGQVQVTVVSGVNATAAAYPSTVVAGGSSTLTATASGGLGPYAYQWDAGQTSPLIVVAPSVTTSYTVTVTDTMGQQTQATVTVTVGVTVGAVAEPDLIVAGDSATLTARASGGAGPYAYTWDNGLTGITVRVAPTATTTYTVTTTDSSGLTGQGQVTVNVVGKLAVTAVASPATIFSGESAKLSATASSGVPPYRFSWSNGQPGAIITDDPASTTSYTVTVTDNLGQQASASVGVEVRYRYDLTVTVDPQGSGSVDPPSGMYDAGTKVTLTAKAQDGYTFAFWGGDLPLTNDPNDLRSNLISLTMDSPKDVTAVFAATKQIQPPTGQPAPTLPALPPGCGGLVGTQQLGLFWALCWVGLAGLYARQGRRRR